ncbi:hypothetical protein D3C74_296420 [compost metagenome]
MLVAREVFGLRSFPFLPVSTSRPRLNIHHAYNKRQLVCLYRTPNRVQLSATPKFESRLHVDGYNGNILSDQLYNRFGQSLHMAVGLHKKSRLQAFLIDPFNQYLQQHFGPRFEQFNIPFTWELDATRTSFRTRAALNKLKRFS